VIALDTLGLHIALVDKKHVLAYVFCDYPTCALCDVAIEL